MNAIKIKPFLETARVWAKQSHCVRLKVGAVILNKKTGRLLSIGYNGTVSGTVNCDALFDSDEYNYYVHGNISQFLSGTGILDDGQWHMTNETEFKRLHHEFSEKYEVHAEQNAIYNLLKTNSAYDPENLMLVCTTEPCCQCAKAIAALGIKYVMFEHKYDRNIESGIKFFDMMGIESWQYSE